TYKKTFEYFEKEDIYFGVGGSSKTFELEKGNTGNLEQIKTELTTFIRALEAADLKPRELKNGWA
ncbi:hypothetical protein, partial [Daejeonella oryzae]|uniref:hypothetical protein n=1 Tax=Daejeonella oryzae TaxID=1122943 RepID=UPI00056D2158